MRLPDYREKQKMLYIDKTPARDLVANGDLYLEKGQLPDALEFYIRASHEQGLEAIRALSEEKGDAMIFLQATRALGRKVSPDEWDRIGNRALERGRLLFARHAFAGSGNEAMKSRVESLIADESNG